jgi:hypothetical protein
MTILKLESVIGERPEFLPAPFGRNDGRLVEELGALLVHLEEQQQSDLLDIVAVADPLVSQHVRIVPDLGNERGVVVADAAVGWSEAEFMGCELRRA